MADDIYIDVSTDPDARAIEFDLTNGAGQQQTVRFDYTETTCTGDANGCDLGGGTVENCVETACTTGAL